MRKKLLALVGAAGVALCGVMLTPAVASASDTLDYYAPLAAVTANHVSGSGGVWISLTGDSAKFTLQVSGLLAGAPHAAQLWVGGAGRCPTPGDASVHNGHLSISTGDAAPALGVVGASLTTSGDTSPASALATSRYPTAGAYTYTRTFTVSPAAAAAVKNGTAVLTVDGVDYNDNGRYDTVLGTTAGDAALPAEATDPALCGSFVAAQMQQSVPAGSADTGGGSAAATSFPMQFALGGLAMLAAVGAAAIAFRRPSARQSSPKAVTNGFRR